MVKIEAILTETKTHVPDLSLVAIDVTMDGRADATEFEINKARTLMNVVKLGAYAMQKATTEDTIKTMEKRIKPKGADKPKGKPVGKARPKFKGKTVSYVPGED